MPAWLYPIIKLAIQIGSPFLLELVKKWFSKLPIEVVQIITDLINNIKNPDIPNREAKAEAKERLKSCSGVACPPETKEV